MTHNAKMDHHGESRLTGAVCCNDSELLDKEIADLERRLAEAKAKRQQLARSQSNRHAHCATPPVSHAGSPSPRLAMSESKTYQSHLPY